MTEKMRKFLTVLLTAVFAISTILLIAHSLDTENAEDSYEQAQQIAGLAQETAPAEETAPSAAADPLDETVPTVPAETEPQTVWVPAEVEADEYMQKLEDTDLDALREVNPNVVGWLFIPNTKINYPIVQGEDNQYYLKHTWDNKKSVAGSIFLETTNASDFSDFRSLVYGHNMADSSMFGSLYRYSNKTYWEAYPYVYLVTDEGVLRYEIYASYKAAVDSSTYALSLNNSKIKSGFIQMTIDESELETGIVPAVTDRILTLSTCMGSADYRRVVHAKLTMVEVEIEIEKDPLQENLLQ